MAIPNTISFASHVTNYLTHRGSTIIALGDKDVMDFAFSGDGEFFCLWERDRNYHYWSVWGSDLKLVRGTIRLKHGVSRN
jgi:hypothetical protein